MLTSFHLVLLYYFWESVTVTFYAQDLVKWFGCIATSWVYNSCPFFKISMWVLRFKKKTQILQFNHIILSWFKFRQIILVSVVTILYFLNLMTLTCLFRLHRRILWVNKNARQMVSGTHTRIKIPKGTPAKLMVCLHLMGRD